MGRKDPLARGADGRRRRLAGASAFSALVGDGFRGVAPDAQGWFPSALLSREFRLLRRPAGGHRWGYRLDSRPLTR